MSTVIISNPQPFQPTKSDGLYFTVSANTASQPKFRFVYNVYVNGYPIFEGKSTPNPYGLGIIDVSRILDTYVTNYPIAYHDETVIFAHQTSPFSRPYSNEVVEYYIEVGEEYADSAVGAITGFTGNGSQVGNPGVPSATLKAFLGTMGVNRKANLPSFNIGQFTLSGNPTPAFPNTENCLFLTNSPRIRDISINEYYTLSFTNYDLGGSFLSEPYYVKYTFYDENGFVITSQTYSNIVSNGGGPASSCTQTYYTDVFTGSSYSILNVGAGPKNIYNFPSNADRYTVQLFGKAIAPTPSPTSSLTPTPTPSQTFGLTPSSTPTLTPTPSSTPQSCNEYLISNLNGFTVQQEYVDCNGLTQTFFLSPYQEYIICLISYTPVYNVTYGLMGSCSTLPTPTPSITPSPSATPPAGSCVSGTTLNITDTGWLKYNDCNGVTQYVQATTLGTFTITACHDCNSILPGYPLADLASWSVKVCGSNCVTPSPTPTPTPSSTSVFGSQNVFVRDCCTGSIEYQVQVSNNLSVDDVIVIAGDCFQIWALGGTGIDGNFTTAPDYINCNECRANYPCTDLPNKPTVMKPSVQPITILPSGGTAPCITYTPVSEEFLFWVKPPCDYFLNPQIMFKNRYGAWDYYRFQKYRSEGLGIDRQTYGQFNVAWGSSNPIKTNYSRGITDYQTNILETHIVNSGFINDPEFVWLEELYTTNDAYLVNEDGTLFPINIVGTEFVRKTKGNRSITNIELTYTYSNNIKLLNN